MTCFQAESNRSNSHLRRSVSLAELDRARCSRNDTKHMTE